MAVVALGGLGAALLLGDAQYSPARMAYGAFAVLSGSLIVWELGRWGWLGLLTPFSATMAGFLYFFCFYPILNPGLIPSLYGDAKAFLPLVAWNTAAVVSFTAGYRFPWAPARRTIDKWLATPVSGGACVLGVVALFVVFLAIAYYLGGASGLGYRAAVMRSGYDLTRGREIIIYEGAADYFQQIFRWLPIAIVPLAAGCAVLFRTTLMGRIMLLAVSLLATLVSVASGIRYVMAYTVGGAGVTVVITAMCKGGSVPHKFRILGAAILVIVVGLAVVQGTTRSAGGLAALLAGQIEFNASDALAATSQEVAADQNYTLRGVLDAFQDGRLQPLWGETLALSVVQMIPRAWWPGKPGGNLAENMAAAGANPFPGANVSYGLTGELAFNFTPIGIPPSMFLWGLVAGTWWRLYRRHWRDPRAAMLYGPSVVPFAFIVRGSFGTMFGGIFHPLLLVVMLLALSRTSSRGTSR